MKKFINIILTLGLVAFTASCVKEYGPHEPGPLDEADCYGVYFPVQEAIGSHTYDPTMPTEVDVVVARKSASNDIVVPIEIVNESGIFNIGEIHFADGQAETVLHIDFPQAGFGEEYAMSVVISDPKYASKYNSGAISFDFSVMRVEWKKFVGSSFKEGETGHIYQICWEEDSDTDLYYYDTSFPGIRYCRLENAWHGNVETVDYVFYWDTKSNRLFVPHQWTGNNNSSGLPIYTGAACDFYNAYYAWGEVCPSADYFTWAPAWIDKNGFFQPYYDGNGNFYLADWLYSCNAAGVPTGSGYQFGGDSEKDADVFMAPGFVRTDYSLEVETDYSDAGVAPFYFTAGVDVSTVKYVVKEGELTATQVSKVVDAIADGSEECQTISEFEYNEDDNVNEAYLEIEFDETNFYTLVAVSFDETGEPKESASATCFAVAADDDSYDVQIVASLEDTPARFQDFDRKSSLGFYIVGKEITDLKFDIFKASDVKKAGLDAVVAEVRELDSVDEEVLATVNSVGGFASIFDELDALTEYTLVVWATNGSKDKVVVSSLTTEGLPNEVIASGAFTGGALLFEEDFTTPTTVEYNPNTEYYEIPNFLGFDAPLVFDLNSDNTIDVIPSYTGLDYEVGAPIYVFEASEAYSKLTKYGLPADAHSYLDEETGNYVFCLAYYIPALEGGFGAAYETFEVGESAEEVAENAESVISTVSTVGCKPGVASLIKEPKVASFRYERDPMSASFSVKSISAKVRSRSIEKNHSLIRINNTDVIF